MTLSKNEVEESILALDAMVAEIRLEIPYYRLGQTYFNALYYYGVDEEFADLIRAGPIDPFHNDGNIEPMKQALRDWWGEDKPPNE